MDKWLDVETGRALNHKGILLDVCRFEGFTAVAFKLAEFAFFHC
jgi:hypothetical protein